MMFYFRVAILLFVLDTGQLRVGIPVVRAQVTGRQSPRDRDKWKVFYGLIGGRWNYEPLWSAWSGGERQQCKIGRLQSPIDLDLNSVIYDPSLRRLSVSNGLIDIKVENYEGGLVFYPSNASDVRNGIAISGGPLGYTYTLYSGLVHWGDGTTPGSEHSISGQKFDAELQLFGYNAMKQWWSSESTERQPEPYEAELLPHGIVGISVMLKQTYGAPSSESFSRIISSLKSISDPKQVNTIDKLWIRALIPDTPEYFTYEGSLTVPPCAETVTWIVMNRPLYVTSQQLSELQQLRVADNVYQKNNFRRWDPGSDLASRLVRTNVKPQQPGCATTKFIQYQFNHKEFSKDEN